MRVARMIGTIGVSLLIATSLSGCDFKSLPHEERYQYINQVLNDIDYRTAGDIAKEEIDNGDGVFAPSYKKVYYGNEDSFEEVMKRLKALDGKCTGDREHSPVMCSYKGTSVNLYTSNQTGVEAYIVITDSSGGK